MINTPSATRIALDIETIQAICGCGARTTVTHIGTVVTKAQCEACRMKGADRDGALEENGKRQVRIAEAQHNMRGLLGQAGVDAAAHGHCRLENFDPVPDEGALMLAQRFCADYEEGQRPNLFLFSKRPGMHIAPGNGKTHLLVAVLARLLEQGELVSGSAVFVRETQMTLELRAQCNGGRPEEYLAKLIRPDLLLLDDVGKAKTDTPWMRELVFELFAARESKATAISSNYSLDELVDRDETFASVASRVLSKGYFRELSGPDRRPERRA